jgi:hypothetical protein
MTPWRASVARTSACLGLACSLTLPAILLLAFLGPFDSREIVPFVTGWLIASVVAVVFCLASLVARPNLMAAVALAVSLLSLVLICAGHQVA